MSCVRHFAAMGRPAWAVPRWVEDYKLPSTNY